MAYIKKICSNCGEESYTGSMYCPVCNTKYENKHREAKKTSSIFQYYEGYHNLHKYGITNLINSFLSFIWIAVLMLVPFFIGYIMNTDDDLSYITDLLPLIILAFIVFLAISIIIAIIGLSALSEIKNYSLGFGDAWDYQVKGIKQGVISDACDYIGNNAFSNGHKVTGAVFEAASLFERGKSSISFYRSKKEFVYSLNGEFRYIKDYTAMKYGNLSLKLTLLTMTIGLALFLVDISLWIYGLYVNKMGIVISGSILTGIVAGMIVVTSIVYDIYLLKSARNFKKHLIRY